MSFEDTYSTAQVPDGVGTFVPKTAIAAGDDITIRPTHRMLWAKIRNHSDTVVTVANSAAGLAAGVGLEIPAQGTDTISAVRAMLRVVIGAAAGGDPAEVSAEISLSREPIETDGSMPDLTVAKGFPAYDGSDPDAIVPGVE